MDDAGGGCTTLADSEGAVCRVYERMTAEQKRAELRAHYAFAGEVWRHKAAAGNAARQSLIRLGERLGKNRTTLLRYAYVYTRIKPDEFEELVSLSDAMGSPPSFWDMIVVVKLSRERRRQALAERLARRRPTGRALDDS